MQIIFLGTSSMVPTKERNHSGLFINYNTQGILVDCGEGTQRQMKIAGISLTKVNKILITHWHGDHVLGLPGLIQSLSSGNYDSTLKIYGPKGIKKYMKMMFEAFIFDKEIDLEINEVGHGVIIDTPEFMIEAEKLEHNIPSLGFSFIEKDKRKINVNYVKKLGIPEGPILGKIQEGKTVSFNGKRVDLDKATKIIKGKKIGIISDTLPCNGANNIAKDADLLICESTYSSELKEKANEHYHLTAKQAAYIANQMGAKKLVLTHFSARYKNTLELIEDTQDYFSDVTCAEDFLKITL